MRKTKYIVKEYKMQYLKNIIMSVIIMAFLPLSARAVNIQIANFDDYVADGWFYFDDGNGGGEAMISQSTDTLYEGTGSVKFAFTTAPKYGTRIAKTFSTPIDMSFANAALSIQVKGSQSVPLHQRFNAIYLYDINGNAAYFYPTTTTPAAWTEIIAQKSLFTPYGAALDYSKITRIDLQFNCYPDDAPVYDIYIDDLRLTDYVVSLPLVYADYLMDAGSGTVLLNSAATGTVLNGTISGATWAADPCNVSNKALYFDGSADYVSLPAFGITTNNMTITAWIKRDGSQTGWSGIVFDRGNVVGLHLWGNSNTLAYSWGSDTQSYDWNSGVELPDNEWVFVALIITPVNGKLYMFDTGGYLLAMNTYTCSQAARTLSSGFDIGRDAYGGRNFKGSIDHVKFYTQALDLEDLGITIPVGVPALGQIESFDDFANNDWYDNNFKDQLPYLLSQSSSGQHEGSGALKIEYNFFPDVYSYYGVDSQWDYPIAKTFTNYLDISPTGNGIADAALRIWVYQSGDPNSARLASIYIMDAFGQSATCKFEEWDTVGWREQVVPVSSILNANPNIDLTRIKWLSLNCTNYQNPDPQFDMYLDDLRLSQDTKQQFKGYYVTAKKVAPGQITLDGSASDWANLKVTTLHQGMEGAALAAGKDRQHDLTFAWDVNNLYVLVEETVIDNHPMEGTPTTWAAAPYQYDGVGLYNIKTPDNSDSGFWIGLSSDGLARVQSPGTAACSVVSGKRITEAKIPFSALMNYTGSIKEGFEFRCDPLMTDSDQDNWDPNGNFLWSGFPTADPYISVAHQSFMGGAITSVQGAVNLTRVRLGLWYDFNSDNIVNFSDLAELASEWSMTDCNGANDWCGGADVAPLGNSDGKVDFKDLELFVLEWLN
jgi:hypothetical protein